MVKDSNQLLKEAKLKVTPTRILVLNAFSDDCKPVNAEYLFGQLKKKGVDIVTIYRTLSSFEKAGILKKVDLQKDSAYYELAGHHHHHIICVDCGTIESLEGCDIKDLSKKVLTKSKKFNLISQHSLEFFGVCKSCIKG